MRRPWILFRRWGGTRAGWTTGPVRRVTTPVQGTTKPEPRPDRRRPRLLGPPGPVLARTGRPPGPWGRLGAWACREGPAPVRPTARVWCGHGGRRPPPPGRLPAAGP